MKTATRKINAQTVINKNVEYKRIWTFRTQEMMDLFINEMQGQISDGAWENSRNTGWLWEGDDIFRLGDKTELKYSGYAWTKKTGYPLTNDLISCISERIYTENGFEFGDVKSLRAAWKEIAEAIKNWKEFTREEKEEYVLKPCARIKKLKENAKEAMMEKLRSSEIINWYNPNKTDYHSWADFTYEDVKFTVWIKNVSIGSGTLTISITHNYNELKVTTKAEKFDETCRKMASVLMSF